MYGKRFNEMGENRHNRMDSEDNCHGRGFGEHMHGHGMRGFGLKYLILNMASDEEMTGADVMVRVDQRTGGRWLPSPGVIYPALKKLYEDGYLEMNERDNKKYYKATERGKEIVRETVFPWNHNQKDENSIESILEKMENYTQYILDNSGKLTENDLNRIKGIYKQVEIFK